MLDTRAIARSLTDAKPDRADAITAAVRAAAEHSDHVTVDKLTGLNALVAPMYRAMLIQTAAIVGAVAAIPPLRG